MKTIKKLSVVIVALTICLLLSATVWAAGSIEVTYSAEFVDSSLLCSSDQPQEVALKVTSSQKIDITSLQFVVAVPSSWEITSVENSDLVFSDEIMNTLEGTDLSALGLSGELKGLRVVWFDGDAENRNTDLLAEIKVTIPANVAVDTYAVKILLEEISCWVNEGDSETLNTFAAEIHTAAEFTISEHSFSDKKSEELASVADCLNAAKYYVQCDRCSVVSSEKTVSYGNANGHAYPATPSSYTDNGDGTHTANYVCGTDATHIEKKDPVAHTYDQEDGTKCVCGATKPVTTVVKGDIDLDGDVDSDDLTLLARHVGGIEVITDTAVLANANVNGDGGVDSDDLTKHARYVGGIITDWSQE